MRIGGHVPCGRNVNGVCWVWVRGWRPANFSGGELVTKGGGGAKTGKSGAVARAERLEVALRANLKKRKEQMRARQPTQEPSAPASSSSKDQSSS
jgi:hypothetical protein